MKDHLNFDKKIHTINGLNTSCLPMEEKPNESAI